MLVIKNVVLAEAVVARAAGAVSELEVGILRVRPAADRALVVIALLPGLFFLLLGGGLELDGAVGIRMGGVAPMAGNHTGDFRPEEDEKVQHRHHRQQRAQQVQLKGCGQNIHGKQRRIQPGQPLYLHGDDKKQQYLKVRIQNGKGEEHGQIDVESAVNNTRAAGKIHDQARQNGQHHARKIVQRKLGRAPFPLQKISDPIVKIKGQNQKENVISVDGQENKGYEPPDFPVKHMVRGKGEKGDGGAAAEPEQQKRNHIARHNIFHQIGNAEPGVVIGEPIHGAVELFQCRTLQAYR
ncbi:hypothetical protein SDC9_67676 [bioreactor metagenome]|uniref:Uncharacterized protein n=1 Tax=bioreactor metagenome TaxID=1076179 RepID=A0A644XY84_9ZZZZ